MKRCIAVFFMVVLMVSACEERETRGDLIIEDVGKPLKDSVVVRMNDGEHVSKAIVRLVGDVDGAFLLNRIKYEEGPIDSVIYEHDWYRPIFKIEYEPIEAKNGYLMVLVEFF
jgi:hypothetical protein